MIHAITYCDRAYHKRAEGISNNLETSRMFDTCSCFNEADIPGEYKETFPVDWFSSSRRGGGWWVWKPYIIRQALEGLGDDDMLLYVDCGCTINNTKNAETRMDEYIDLINHSQSKMLVFQLPSHPEVDWTNSHCINYMYKRYNVRDSQKCQIEQSSQIISGIIMMRKHEFTLKFCDEWLYAAQADQGKLFSEHYSARGEKHRHDQSCLSLIYKMHQGDLIVPDETWFGSRSGFGSDVSLNYPIWATRLK
jgi:hypothetical protein